MPRRIWEVEEETQFLEEVLAWCRFVITVVVLTVFGAFVLLRIFFLGPLAVRAEEMLFNAVPFISLLLK